MLPTPPTQFFTRFNQLCLDFIWRGKKAKIARNILAASKEHGGAGMIDLKIKDKALKISWIQVLKNDPQMAKIAYYMLCSPLEENVWRCNIHSKDVEVLFPDSFWKDVLLYWTEVNYEKDVQAPAEQMIWYNSHIRIEEKPFFWKQAYDRELCNLGQIWENGHLNSALAMCQTYGLSMMEYNSIVSAIPSRWKTMLRQAERTFTPSKYDVMVKKDHLASFIYKELISDNSLLVTKWNSWRDTWNDVE